MKVRERTFMQTSAADVALWRRHHKCKCNDVTIHMRDNHSQKTKKKTQTRCAMLQKLPYRVEVHLKLKQIWTASKLAVQISKAEEIS